MRRSGVMPDNTGSQVQGPTSTPGRAARFGRWTEWRARVDVRELLDRDLAFLDCEMTGVDPERNEIIEIGCARTRLPALESPAELGVKVVPRTMRGSDRNSIRIASYS